MEEKLSPFKALRKKVADEVHRDYHRLLDGGTASLTAVDEAAKKHGLFHNSTAYRKIKAKNVEIIKGFALLRDDGQSQEAALVAIKARYPALSEATLERILKKELEQVEV